MACSGSVGVDVSSSNACRGPSESDVTAAQQ
jgi:hypothetical protein